MSYQSFNTSSAYKLETYENRQKDMTTHKTRANRKNPRKALVRKIKRYAMVATIVVLAFMMVKGYVALDELDGTITGLKKEYNSITAKNQAIQAEIDKNLDLEELQRIAADEYDMSRPERYQVFYVDMGGKDMGKTVTEEKEEKKNSIEGASGMLVDSMNIFD